MDQELLSFNKLKPNSNIIDDLWEFDVNNLETTSSTMLTKLITGAAQYLVYYKAQINDTKAKLSMKQADMDIALNVAIKPELIKEYGTKTAAKDYLITTDKVVGELHREIQELRQSLAKVDGMDRAITEYINAFKRELDRRKHEREVARMERH
jgi:hypothetical protein